MIAIPEMFRAAAETLRPPERLRPSVFAERYRVLREGTTFAPGPWSNDVFPYLAPIMDAVAEAIETGKRGVVLMKSGQGGGSEAMINTFAWLRCLYSGPMLYLISKDELASEFSRERFSPMDETCAPLGRIALRGRAHGELLHVRRYATGKVVIRGGQSVLNLQSTPYRFVYVDEIDSLADELKSQGDPLAMAEIRTDAFPGETLIVAFGHPTTKERGAGRLYYEMSDQRRAHVDCPAGCGGVFWPRWEDVRAGEDADDAAGYRYVAPCCGSELSDAQRWLAARRTRQVSVLPPEEARKKPWIGLHFSQLLMPNKPLAFLAEKFIEARDDQPKLKVFWNKRQGDTHDQTIKEVAAEGVRAIAERDREIPARVLPQWCGLVTVGVDTQGSHFVYVVRAWGPGQASRLVDWGKVDGFNQLCPDGGGGLLDHPWPFDGEAEGGRSMRARIMLIDAGGTRGELDDASRTHEVYTFARRSSRIMPAMGRTNIDVPWRVKHGHEYRPAGGGRGYHVDLVLHDPDYHKDVLSGWIGAAKATWQLCAGVAEDVRGYLWEMTGEHKVRSDDGSTWQKRTEQRRVDYWDAEVLALTGARVCGVERLTTAGQKPPADWFAGRRERRGR